jgi:membrane protein DedA with SNARE-associated domain
MIALLDTIFESLTDISTSQWFYLIIFSVALLDSVVPVVPSESMVIVGGVAAGLGDLEIPFVIVVAAIGASLGARQAGLSIVAIDVQRKVRNDSIGRTANW